MSDSKKQPALVIPDEIIVRKIYLLRGKKVILDRDLAELYGVTTRRLKEQVRRNRDRFPENFMFELTRRELADWRSQFATSNREVMGMRIPPFAFTEHGALMAATVLNSKKATQVSIRIINVFIQMRDMLLTEKNIRLRIKEIEKRVGKQDEKIEMVAGYLKKFLRQDQTRRRIGFRRHEEE